MNTVKKQHATKKRRPYTAKDGTIVMLTDNQKAYADAKLAAAPGTALIAAAKKAYPNALPGTLSQVVQQNEKNYAISIYSSDQVALAKSTVVELTGKGVKDSVRLSAAQDILDRNTGRATQKTEVTTTRLNININLSGMAEAEEAGSHNIPFATPQ